MSHEDLEVVSIIVLREEIGEPLPNALLPDMVLIIEIPSWS